MPPAQVRLENLGKRYGDLWAVRNISLCVERGAFYTLLGPSGCGKTTILRAIAGFALADEGEIYLDGEAVTYVPPWKRDVGLVFQHYALWPHMTVFENIAFGLKERRVRRADIQRKVKEVLHQVGLSGTEDRKPSQLSGGQQQRVALARTLVIQPRVLLLDEPLSNLDAKLRTEMRIELLKLQRDLGITTIYVTHDQEEALALSTRIAVVSAGRIVQEGRPREIYELPSEKFVADFVGKSNLFVGTVTGKQGDLIQFQTDEGWRIQATAPAAYASITPGQQWLLNIRPEAMEVTSPAEGASQANRIRGQVAASAYQGSLVEYDIEAAGRSIRANLINPKRKQLFQRGDEVALVFLPEDVGVISVAQD
ncbi:MAG: ABC transporter ATP-binding protein [Deltaproteobacteria bacterium]|nr:ABC transporter ATP-binding protein [Deltaproteobacteria bacterium]